MVSHYINAELTHDSSDSLRTSVCLAVPNNFVNAGIQHRSFELLPIFGDGLKDQAAAVWV
jgi:hypothetical protein